ncbi:MAG: universal stress protein [Gammaproteobacteria bacterium]|nr:universal stress protein [Gammaproteobacteria bacterium]NIR83283.1 universal stress protein [Gammaproteobacteria bacterium]NIR91083.1 universal stress protein [Gammaproteobacteria bacterium]NIU04450.1 universal stress protein [Gammaproteobacteria bacterium]NIW87086.1 universal stress protein [Gammaproteobacteria bacterium]
MRTILVPLHDEEVARSALDSAYLVAQRFGSYVEGLFVQPLPQIVAGEGITVPGAYVMQPVEEGRELAARVRNLFERFTGERNVPLGDVDTKSEGPSAGWREMEGLESQIVAEYGRLFDLIVIGRPDRQLPPDWSAMCEGALFESGRPVLVAPVASPDALGHRILVAWNGSTETARTIALGMHFLQAAEHVEVLTVEGGTVAGPSGEDVARHLVRNGVKAQARTAAMDGKSVGEAILAEASSVSADLLVKGAYTQSRLRQMIFGGATRHILNHATLPVLLAH